MSIEKSLKIIEHLPRWLLVILAAFGVAGLWDLHGQIKSDHQTVSQHSQKIEKLEEISARMLTIIERRSFNRTQP